MNRPTLSLLSYRGLSLLLGSEMFKKVVILKGLSDVPDKIFVAKSVVLISN